MSNQDEEEIFTISDVVNRIINIQDFKLANLQECLFIGKDVLITKIVAKKSLVRLIEKYRKHYSKVEIDENTILIKKLSKLSFLRVGLEKEILKYAENYYD
jgi:hypothetical protein